MAEIIDRFEKKTKKVVKFRKLKKFEEKQLKLRKQRNNFLKLKKGGIIVGIKLKKMMTQVEKLSINFAE